MAKYRMTKIKVGGDLDIFPVAYGVIGIAFLVMLFLFLFVFSKPRKKPLEQSD